MTAKVCPVTRRDDRPVAALSLLRVACPLRFPDLHSAKLIVENEEIFGLPARIAVLKNESSPAQSQDFPPSARIRWGLDPMESRVPPSAA